MGHETRHVCGAVMTREADGTFGCPVCAATTRARMPPHRIQLSRKKGWRMPLGAIKVSRPSVWGNPFKVDAFGHILAVELYANMIRGVWNPALLDGRSDHLVDLAYHSQHAWRSRLDTHPTEAARLMLAGFNLACWCPLDQICHADVLLVAANDVISPAAEEGQNAEKERR